MLSCPVLSRLVVFACGCAGTIGLFFGYADAMVEGGEFIVEAFFVFHFIKFIF